MMFRYCIIWYSIVHYHNLTLAFHLLNLVLLPLAIQLGVPLGFFFVVVDIDPLLGISFAVSRLALSPPSRPRPLVESRSAIPPTPTPSTIQEDLLPILLLPLPLLLLRILRLLSPISLAPLSISDASFFSPFRSIRGCRFAEVWDRSSSLVPAPRPFFCFGG